MVFVPVHTRRNAVEPTREEAALLRDLDAKGVGPDDLEAALAGRGVPPERARQLAGLFRPRSAGERVQAIATALGWGVVLVLFGVAQRPLRQWLRENWPGSEWLVDLVIPAIVLLAFLATLVARVQAVRRAREAGLTSADQIENKPIG